MNDRMIQCGIERGHIWAASSDPAMKEQSVPEFSLVIHDQVEPSEQYSSCVPLYSLQAVAGYFDNEQEVVPEGWVAVDVPLKLQFGMFVAKVTGHSMEPRIPDGSYCLFQSVETTGVGDEDIVLVQHHTYKDPEHGGSYAVKRLVHTSSGEARLRSIHPDFEEFPVDEDYSVTALFLNVLSSAP